MSKKTGRSTPLPPSSSVRNSIIVATGSSLVATALATMLAILATRFQFRGKADCAGDSPFCLWWFPIWCSG